MRMSLMFAAVTLLTGINLFFIPFQPVPALWGAILAVAFVLINVVTVNCANCRPGRLTRRRWRWLITYTTVSAKWIRIIS